MKLVHNFPLLDHIIGRNGLKNTIVTSSVPFKTYWLIVLAVTKTTGKLSKCSCILRSVDH